MKLFLVLTFCSSLSWGAHYTFTRSNKMGLSKVTTFEESKGHYIFEGKDLGTKLPPKVKAAWNSLKVAPERKPASRCWSGTFVFTIKNAGKTSKSSGCSEGPQYGQMIGNTETVRNFAVQVK
ncbi:hypothetical protein B9G69_000795 [Bdellovibrio sp. SKB1291214]|uniref:hypothetical protein n=1 Tax=Bdellovibrio sp. SKB1291214 TaxID=1732569 RepID=UPI000B72AF9E|nr:hypothetical protein [Bdellovibrio sp. SKB1291214]UYL09112.1 hypothetical protein B9G69_000795 [Bdellovibrio sp. SKB1291214]